MRVPCSCPTCSNRRPHHDRPYDPGYIRMIDVPDDVVSKFIYCSYECSCYDRTRREKILAEMASSDEPITGT